MDFLSVFDIIAHQLELKVEIWNCSRRKGNKPQSEHFDLCNIGQHAYLSVPVTLCDHFLLLCHVGEQQSTPLAAFQANSSSIQLQLQTGKDSTVDSKRCYNIEEHCKKLKKMCLIYLLCRRHCRRGLIVIFQGTNIHLDTINDRPFSIFKTVFFKEFYYVWSSFGQTRCRHSGE